MAHLHWRINITANNGGSGYLTIAEIEMRGSVGGSDLCTGGTATASVNSGAASVLFDNSPSSFWDTGGSSQTGWVAYQFPSPVDIVEYTIRAQDNASYLDESPKDWKMQYSDDGSSWYDSFSSVTNQTGWAASEIRTFLNMEVSPFYRTLTEAATVLGETAGRADLNYVFFLALPDGLSLTATSANVFGKMGEIFETLSTLESQSLGFGRKVADGLTYGEAVSAHIAKVVQEYFLAADKLILNCRGGLSISDGFMAVDTFDTAKVYLNLLAEILSIGELLKVASAFLVKEGITTYDSNSAGWKGTGGLAETLEFLCKVANHQGYSDAVADTVDIADAPLTAVVLALLAQEALSTQENLALSYVADLKLENKLTLSAAVTNQGRWQGKITDKLTFHLTVTLNGEVYQCWAFSTDAMLASIYTNYDFTSYVNVDGQIFATRTDGIYLLEGADDAGKKIQTGVKLNYYSMGTHLKKRLFNAWFGLVGDKPALRVVTDTGGLDYYVIDGRVDLAKGAVGRDWELILTDVDAVDFVEITPVILSR